MGAAQIVEYDETWPMRAAEWMTLLAEVTEPLRGSRGFTFAHIGSTSVPGLAAKPLIDLQMLAPVLPYEGELTAVLEPIGLERARGSRPDSPGVDFDIPRPGTDSDPSRHVKYLFHSEASGVILHVRRADSPFAAYVLAFRDWLCADVANARRYELLKRSLADRFAGAEDYDDYTRAKTAFLDEVQIEMRFHG